MLQFFGSFFLLDCYLECAVVFVLAVYECQLPKEFQACKDKFSLPHIFVFENMHIKHIEIPRKHTYKLFVCCREYRMRRDGFAHIYWKNMHPFHVNDLNSNLFSCLWYVCVIGCLYSVSIPISNAVKNFHCIELLFVFNFIST